MTDPSFSKVVTTAIAQTDSRQPATAMTVIATRHPINSLHVYEITEQELEVIENANFLRTFYSMFVAASLSAGISFGLCLWTVPIVNSYTFASFIAVVAVSCVVLLASCVLWARAEWQIVKTRRRIRGMKNAPTSTALET